MIVIPHVSYIDSKRVWNIISFYDKKKFQLTKVAYPQVLKDIISLSILSEMKALIKVKSTNSAWLTNFILHFPPFIRLCRREFLLTVDEESAANAANLKKGPWTFNGSLAKEQPPWRVLRQKKQIYLIFCWRQINKHYFDKSIAAHLMLFLWYVSVYIKLLRQAPNTLEPNI